MVVLDVKGEEVDEGNNYRVKCNILKHVGRERLCWSG